MPMEAASNQLLEKHLKKFQLTSSLLTIVVTIVTAFGLWFAFYYRTTATLQIHTQQIEEVKVDIKTLTNAVNETAVFKGASQEQIKSVESQITDVKKSVTRIEDKLDKLVTFATQ